MRAKLVLDALVLANLVAQPISAASSSFLSKQTANSRLKRSNDGFFEELGEASLKRECKQEQCDSEELNEVFSGFRLKEQFLDTKCDEKDEVCREAVIFKKKTVKIESEKKKLYQQCNNKKLVKCDVHNTKFCRNAYNGYECVCNDFWSGEFCEECDHCKSKGTRKCLKDGICECRNGWGGKKCGWKIDAIDGVVENEVPTLYLNEAEEFSTKKIEAFKPAENMAEVCTVLIVLVGLLVCCFATYTLEIKIMN